MSGKASRDRGNRYERQLCPVLADPLDLAEVITSRNGRGGSQGGADFMSRRHGDPGFTPGICGWELDAKDVASRQVPTWLTKAQTDATKTGLRWFAIVHKTRGEGDRLTHDRVYLPTRMLLDFLLYGAPTVDLYNCDDYVTLTLDQWCEIAS